ncbi:fibronectin type III domain protein [Necator americanus]|uniref:Fibronectin type III domain protein n=1 Tax=Necator americanus TaxID=51031 RepID=W2T1P1_NECAM|nr:fibronectin type III domain protein [Necator americanus]ETN75161.1 fibronectin type III domain protein [Necator americanus]
MASYCAARLGPPPSFPSTSCMQDSDCGSSSGLGGMKTQELVSDEGGSSSSEQPGFFPRPSVLPCGPPINGVTGMTVPTWVHPTPPGAPNDLFVHIQMGETLNILVGNDVQNITGPATVRMVGECGMSPSALPIHVPPGHVIHQIVDEQGILRHLILSPETPSPPRFPPPNAANSGYMSSRIASSPPLAVPPFHPALYTVNRKWSHNGKLTMPDLVPSASSRNDEQETDIDGEEWDKVREMLGRILAPQVVRVGPTEADIAWQQLDTSEAAAPGGPFPQIDASEFTYQIVLFENHGRFVSTYRCETETGNKLRLCQLRPNTDYYVQLKACLEERGLVGEPSQPVCFKTAPGRPEAPLMFRCVARGIDHLVVAWRPPNDNGAAIVNYTVYISKPSDDIGEKVWEGRSCEARITSLRPATSYRFRVTATNRIGESSEAAPIVVTTRSDCPPPVPPPPNVVSVNARCVKLAWSNNPECTYTVEMHDVAAGQNAITIVKDHVAGANAQIMDLKAGSEYRFRVIAHNAEGDSPRSDWTYVRMTGRGTPDRVLEPTKPLAVARGRNKFDVSWKCPGAKEREFTYVLEGSTANHPTRFRVLYRGPLSTHTVTDEDIVHLRVQSVNRKNVASDFSETITLVREPELVITKPSQLPSPVIEGCGKGAVRVSWAVPKMVIPPTATLMFELRRIDDKTEIVYSGSEANCRLEGLSSRQHVEVQVRAVVVAQDGSRYEGDWSPVTGGNAPRDAPNTPTELAINNERTMLTWKAPETSPDIRYRVHCGQVMSGHEVEETICETGECHYSLALLEHAKQFTCRVSAFHDGGESPLSQPLVFTTRSGAPAQPDGVTIESDGTRALVLRWSVPDCRGSPITQYLLRVETKSEMVREISIVPPSTSGQCEYRIADLQADTDYRVELSAENTVGCGVAAAITGRTRPPPPDPPKIECECEATSLRLRWKPASTHTLLTYKSVFFSLSSNFGNFGKKENFGENYPRFRVVRLGDGEKMISVYEGDMCSTRIKGLTENTEYRFQIRSTDRHTGAGPWSSVYVFRTALSPPPAVKGPPTATPSGDGYYQLEWSSVITKPNTKKCFYRLQAVDCSIDNAKWMTVYEGTLPSCTLRLSDYPSAVQARVMCVRPEGSNEISSPPSPIPVQEKKVDTIPVVRWWTMQCSLTTIMVVLFIVVSFTMALFFDSMFNLYVPPNAVARDDTVESLDPPRTTH